MKIKNIQDLVIPPNKIIVFVTGVTGQDGSTMIDYLLKNTDSIVVGGARRLSVENHHNISHLENEQRFQLVNFDLTDSHSIYKLMEVAKPDYFINFAAQSFVASSWDFSEQTLDTNVKGVVHCLEAIRKTKPSCRFYNAGSSEEFGNIEYSPQDEKHPLRPRSPYGASKASARHYVKVYRESYGLYAVQGWLFNHEGTRRGEEFVTRKITKGIAKIVKELERTKHPEYIELGNLDAKRDWSDTEDMVDAVWKMLNQDTYNNKIKPLKITIEQNTFCNNDFQNWWKNDLLPNIKDYVVSSDENHSIREFIEEAFNAAGYEGEWKGTGLNEMYWVFITPNHDAPTLPVIGINPKFYRPAEVDILCGNSSLIRKELGWKPQTTFKELVRKMVINDLK